jgi:hypothetical protein
MIKKRHLFICLCLLFTESAFPARNFTELLGVPIPMQMNLFQTKEEVLLNGDAVVSTWGQPVYVGALYVPHIEKRAEMLLINDAPMAMIFYIVRDDISAEMMNKLFTEGILINNGGWENQRLDKKRILELQKALDQPFNAGDIIAFHYSPKNGVLMLIDGELKYHWPYAKTFFNMLLRMWIGPYPPTRDFKRAILDFPASKYADGEE